MAKAAQNVPKLPYSIQTSSWLNVNNLLTLNPKGYNASSTCVQLTKRVVSKTYGRRFATLQEEGALTDVSLCPASALSERATSAPAVLVISKWNQTGRGREGVELGRGRKGLGCAGVGPAMASTTESCVLLHYSSLCWPNSQWKLE